MLIGALFLFIVLWAWRTFAISEPLVQCIKERQGHPEYGQLHNISASLGFLLAWLDIRSACAIHIANKYNSAITAFGGIAVAFFTLALWVSTEKLWKEAAIERAANERQRIVDTEERRLDREQFERSLSVSSQAAAASKALADTAADTAKRQLRAYVLVEGAIASEFIIGNGIDSETRIKNFGQTPAYDVRQWSAMGFDHFPPTTNIPLPEGTDVRSSSIIGPGSSISVLGSLNRPLTINELNGLVGGRLGVYAKGRITYCNIFGDEHVTDYMLFAGGKLGDVRNMGAYTEGNAAT